VSLRSAWARLTGLVTRRRRDRDLDDEVGFHLQMLADEHQRRGMSAPEAETAARRDFGGVLQMKEAHRDQRSLPWLEPTIQDARYALRSLRRTPGFTLTALLMLSLGIGATTAVFSLFNALILEGLPYRTADRLVVLGDMSASGLPSTIGYETVDDIRARVQSLDALTAVRSWQPTLVVGGEAERLAALRVSWDFFDMLGVRPALGRGFTPAEDTAAGWQVVVLSDTLWRSRFGADPGVIGRTITMNDLEYRIAGVMPAEFEPAVSAAFYAPAQLWAPLGYEAGLPSACRTCRHLRSIGRLRDGVTIEQARAELDAIRQQLAAAHPTSYPDGRLAMVSLHDLITGPVTPVLYVLLGAVTFVLLIACANLANLLLSRAVTRDREFAVRGALGAGRGRIARQVLTESLVLSLCGGALGVVVAIVLVEAAPALAPSAVPRLDAVTIDRSVLAFAAGVSVLTGLLFGSLPAWRGSAAGGRRSLASDGRGSIGAASGLARGLLVAADVALALMLLAGAGLMIQTVNRLLGTSPGFDPDRVLSLQFSLVGERYREDPAVFSFIEQAVERVAALPGVEAAAAAGQIPLGGNHDGRGVHVEGALTANPADAPSLERYSVTPDYFRVMRIGLERGRLFTGADSRDALLVAIVSQRTATSLWPGVDPIGRRIRVGGGAGPWRTVVGIVGDVHHRDLTGEPPLQMYLPQAQFTDSFLVMTVRTAEDRPERIAPDVRQVIRQLDPTVPVHSVAPLADLVSRSFADRRFVMRLLGSFALIALVLAAAGLYGVVSYALAQRTREFGLRMALGATRAHVAGLVLAGNSRPLAAGLLVGVAGAFALTRSLDSLLFGVSATDPSTFAAAAGVLIAVATAAHLPAVGRALRVDPSVALRQD
jgi:putative ABC transport system permease protein